MARVHIVSRGDLDKVPGWEELGPEAADIGLEGFQVRIRRHPGELKNLVKNRSFMAGIGNAYSDEVLFHAGMLPLRRRSTLAPAEVATLQEGGEVTNFCRGCQR